MPNECILVVDDEIDLATSCQRLLQSKGYEVRLASSAEDAIQVVAGQDVQLVLTDLKMSGMGGMELLRTLRAEHPEIPVVMMTGYSTVEDAVEAMSLGAANFVPKPFTPDHLLIVVDKALQERSLRRENRNLRDQLSRQYSFDNIIGKSAGMAQVFESIRKIADTDISVIISGASGTGKELIANSIHVHSRRTGQPFVPINCGALPENRVESALFGYEKGAFTGAVRAKPGLFEEAHGGTFFMDEVGELPLPLQVKLLRVLQESCFYPVGSTKLVEVDIRIVCATNRDLEEAIAEGLFREDLFYRINVLNIEMPPLRKRREDIPQLVAHFVAKHAPRVNARITEFHPKALAKLTAYRWPGNIRELENSIERLLVYYGQERAILPEHVEALMPKSQRKDDAASMDDFEGLPLEDATRKVEDYLIRRALDRAGNVQSRAAELLGTTRRILKYKIDQLGIGSG